MNCHRIILLISTWLISAVQIEAQTNLNDGSGSGDGNNTMSILMPEETVPSSIVDVSTSSMTTETVFVALTSAATNILKPGTARTTTVIPSSSIMVDQSVTTLQFLPTSMISASATTPPTDSSSMPTGIETTTTLNTLSLPTFTSTSFTPLPTTEPTPTTATTTVPTIETDETTTNERTTTSDASTTTESEITTTMSTSVLGPAAENPLSTVQIIIIIIAVVAFLIIVFTVVSCVLAGLICKRSKKEDPVKRDILSNWELQEPPKHGGARLMKIRTLDSMEEIESAAGIEGSNREQHEPRGVVGRNIRETSEGGSNTVFTFGVPMVVDKTVGKSDETAQTVSESRQNGRSETLNDRAVQDRIKESANGLKENKASGVTKAPTTTMETTFTTSTFGPIPSLSLNEVEPPKPLKTDAIGENSGAAAFTSNKETNKPFQDSFLGGHKSELEQNSLVKEDVMRAFGVGQGLFQDFEVTTQL